MCARLFLLVGGVGGHLALLDHRLGAYDALTILALLRVHRLLASELAQQLLVGCSNKQ